jgi:enoyl-[acyl-carrier protein] reductase I
MAALDRAFASSKSAGAGSTSSSTRSAFPTRTSFAGKFVDTSLDNFLMTMNISVYSFVAVTQRARAMMPKPAAAC